MSEDGDIDVESAEDVPDIGVEATATTINSNGDIYGDGSHPDKRAHHNALERRRRDHIKDSFHSLRDCIPSLVGEKVSRAHILNKATEYIRHMQKGGSTREDDICDMARKNEILEEQVRALDDAKLRGGVINAEDVLQSVASRVEARQLQEERLQQAQPKNNSKSTKQGPNKVISKTSSLNTTSEKLLQKTVPISKNADTPTTTSSSLLPPNFNLLANNIKSTQSLLSVLQKNFSPSHSLPPSIKSLAARVLASPLIRNAQKNTSTKTTQASSIHRGIVTATTVNATKGTAQTSPAATPPSKSSSAPRRTGIAAPSSPEFDDVAQMVSKGEMPASEVGFQQAPDDVALSSGDLDLETSDVSPSQEYPQANSPSVGVPPMFLTSQLLEEHNLLQQQETVMATSGSGTGLEGGGMGTAAATTVAAPQGDDREVDPPDPTPLTLGAVAQGLTISPELLAQVTSLFNIPVPTVAMATTIASSNQSCSSGASLNLQDTSSQPLIQATPTTTPPTSHKRPSTVCDNTPEPTAKRPHLQQQ